MIDYECAQAIKYPATSVWSIAAAPDDFEGDFVVGGSDGILRIFTSNMKRTIQEEALKATL
jgi:phospholipase A-2-activating protein